VTPDQFFGVERVDVVFNAPPSVTTIPNWGWTGSDSPTLVGVGVAGPNSLTLLFDQIVPTALVVPADSVGVRSATGGAVVPGTYPVV